MQNDTGPEPALITARDLSRMLSISLPSVWRWLAAGKLPQPLRLSAQCLRWDREDVAAFLAVKRAEAQNQRPASANGEASESPDSCREAKSGVSA